MKFFLDNKKKLVIAIVIVELLLLAINVFRFNRSESYLFSQDDFQVDYLNPETNKYERASGAYADHTDKVQSLIFTKPVRLEKGIYNIYVNYSSNADINWHLCYTTLQACLDVSNTKAAHLAYCDKVAGLRCRAAEGRHLRYRFLLSRCSQGPGPHPRAGIGRSRA